MNRLQYERSPYLRQHAHNPVDWYPWGQEALQRAQDEDKPILLSIGYATCHWCHVMERESFEDQDIARLMNDNFICIKVDREERPDVDALYMEAVQVLLQGGGGWPLNCFLLPDTRPFYGGTYFPPQALRGRASWEQVLRNISKAYRQNRSQTEEQASKLMAYLQRSEGYFLTEINPEMQADSLFQKENLWKTYENLREDFDKIEGGFGQAPKFPGIMALRFCLYFYQQTQEAEALQHVQFSMQKLLRGGIFDQLRGGWARYAVDRAWLVPHFEKMLYDNALILGLLAELQQFQAQDEYLDAAQKTWNWLKTEMQASNGLFYSALDADSEGEEGKFYVWSWEELQNALGQDLAWFAPYYQLSPEGNFEGHNILNRKTEAASFAQSQNLSPESFKKQLENAEQKLLKIQNQRIRPGLDDKQLLDWNALMLSNLCRLHRAMPSLNLGPELQRAFAALPQVFCAQGTWQHQAEGPKQEAFLDDYAFLIEAYLEYYRITWNTQFLEQAQALADYVHSHFFDPENQLYFFAPANTELAYRKKDLYDNATPSGNATMLRNWQILHLAFGQNAYAQRAETMLQRMSESLQKFPRSFALWATAALAWWKPAAEWALLGSDFQAQAQALQTRFLAYDWVMAAAETQEKWPLLDRPAGQNGTCLSYRCQNFACALPRSDWRDWWS